MEGRPPPAASKPYAKVGVLLDGTEPVLPVLQCGKVDRALRAPCLPTRAAARFLECAFGDWFAIARGAHDPPAACRLGPRDGFFNSLLERCALQLVATQSRGDGNARFASPALHFAHNPVRQKN